jgi:hypothetical protein
MCSEDKNNDTDLIGLLKNKKSSNQNEIVSFNNSVTGQVYLIELIPDIESEYCPKTCPSLKYDQLNFDWSIGSCSVCHKMILVLQSSKLQQLEFDKEKCFENAYKLDGKLDQNISLELLYKYVYIVKSSTEIQLPASILSYSSSHFNKDHFCSVESKLINFKEPIISSKGILTIALIKLLVILAIFFILTVMYSYRLYGKLLLF